MDLWIAVRGGRLVHTTPVREEVVSICTRKRSDGFFVTDIRWSPEAIADVEAVRCFITRDSPTYAALVAVRIAAAVERLALFP